MTPRKGVQTLRSVLEASIDRCLSENVSRPQRIEIIHSTVKDFLAQKFSVLTVSHDPLLAEAVSQLWKVIISGAL
jgi:phosphohistidine phosphatase SixA